jgi:hypothetical protein
MSYYYILPKKNVIDFDIQPIYSREPVSHVVSHSLFYYLNETKKQIKTLCKNNIFFSVNDIFKMLNSHEYVYSTVPLTKLSVSKLKPASNSFYILMEIDNMFHIFKDFSDLNEMKILALGRNADSIIEYAGMCREDKTDICMSQKTGVFDSIKIDTDLTFHLYSFYFIFFELEPEMYNNVNEYAIGMISILSKILLYQSPNGVSVIKVDNLFYKPILDVLYVLSAMYEKVYITKPLVTNINSGERYIICKNYNIDNIRVKHYQKYIDSLFRIRTDQTTNIVSLFKHDLPYFFINKIEESNIIIGHQQLEHLDSIINLLKNKNKDDKMETIKKNNIQKCIQWCEKHKIPFNKFTEKTNLFHSLPPPPQPSSLHNSATHTDVGDCCSVDAPSNVTHL